MYATRIDARSFAMLICEKTTLKQRSRVLMWTPSGVAPGAHSVANPVLGTLHWASACNRCTMAPLLAQYRYLNRLNASITAWLASSA